MSGNIKGESSGWYIFSRITRFSFWANELKGASMIDLSPNSTSSIDDSMSLSVKLKFMKEAS